MAHFRRDQNHVALMQGELFLIEAVNAAADQLKIQFVLEVCMDLKHVAGLPELHMVHIDEALFQDDPSCTVDPKDGSVLIYSQFFRECQENTISKKETQKTG